MNYKKKYLKYKLKYLICKKILSGGAHSESTTIPSTFYRKNRREKQREKRKEKNRKLKPLIKPLKKEEKMKMLISSFSTRYRKTIILRKGVSSSS